MRDPVEIILDWIKEEKGESNEIPINCIENLYNEQEFTFTISKSNIQSKTYTRKLNELTKEEKELLLGEWLYKFDTRPKFKNEQS
jgi:hypothetical protein